jgi:hypothetical protein
VAAWGFNEGTGTIAADASGNNNTGTLSGATWSTLGLYGHGTALSFDGVSNLVLVNNAPSLNLTNGMTVSAWVFPTAAQTGWRTIVQRAVDAYFLHASSDAGGLRPAAGGTFNGNGNTVVGPAAIAVNTWTHLAATYDGTTLRLFVNGNQVSTTNVNGLLQTNSNPLRIGGNVPYGEYFQGRIDDVRIYNRPQTAAEIQSDMNASVSSTPRLVILQPAAGSTIFSTTVSVAYSTTGDLTEVNHVHFQMDSDPEVMDLSFDGAYEFTNVLVGSHVLHGWLVRADHSKILDTDASVSFATAAPDPTPPTVAITAPSAGATVTGTVTVTATASDNSGVIGGVQFFLDGTPIGPEVTTAPYSSPWNTVSASNGTHSLTARARDGAGNSATSAAVSVTVSNNTSTNPAVVGQWSNVLSWPLVALNMTLMPNGKVLAYDDHTDGTGAGVFDPATLSMTTVPFLAANLFCSGNNLLPDGRVFVAGGHKETHIGIPNASIFSPTTQTWSSGPPMAVGRWYPTSTALPDGRMLVLGGEVNCNNCNAPIPEIFDPAGAGSWTRLANAPMDLQYYPHVFVNPDGRIVVTGANRLEMATYALDIATQTWTTVDPAVLNAGSSVMYLPGKYMKSGRGRDPDLPGAPSVATTYVLDMSAATPRWRQTASMTYPRTEHNLTILADGTVLTSGGALNSDVFDLNAPVLTPELWDPVTEAYTLMAPMPHPRIYHSTALLMPDGRVLSAGGGRYGPNYLEAEFWSPPYLFKGPRPTITSAPSTLGYGGSFFVGTAATDIRAVNLMRTGAVTHAFNQNQRFLPLAFQQTTGGLTVQMPSGPNAAPPGYYMLFILNANGVPSVAPIIKVQ